MGTEGTHRIRAAAQACRDTFQSRSMLHQRTDQLLFPNGCVKLAATTIRFLSGHGLRTLGTPP